MPRYKYRAMDENGSIVQAEAVFGSEAELLAELQSRGLTPVEVKSLGGDSQEDKKGFNLNISIGGGGVKDRDISIFCRQLGTMVNAGLAVVDGLNIIADQLPNKTLSTAAKNVAKMVSEGLPISTAMSKYPKAFPEFVVNLVKVGEETGNLDLALKRAADYYEKMAMIKSKIKSASFYPTFVFIVAVVIITGILYFLVPTFAEIYKSMGGELPAPTRLLLAASDVVRTKMPIVIGLFIVIFAIHKYLMKTVYPYKRAVHQFSLKAPKMGELVMKSTMAKFSRTMATLFSSGVTLERSFEIAGQVTGNVIIKEALEKAKKGVLEGEPMHKAIGKTKMFPPLVVSMIRVGEDTGRLDEMLDTIARFFEDEFDKTVEGLIKMIEPMLIVFIGGSVGVILIALYLPIFKMGDLMKTG